MPATKWPMVGAAMKWRGWVVALLMVCASTPLALAQSNMDGTSGEQSVPRLGDIMNAVQTRHIKLWFAGKALNWELAAYELQQLKAGLLQAAVMYPGIPVTNVTTMSNPVQAVADAIAAKDIRRFSKAAGELTAGCNSCHRSMGRGFIAVRAPTEQPFSDQVFAPQGKP
jgi:hypothetical protein